MHVAPLQTEADYRAALSRVFALVSLDPAIGTAEGDELAMLSVRVERYESDRFPFPRPTPAEAIRFRIEQAGATDADLQRYIGEPDVLAAVLSGEQPLSNAMIQRLHEGLQIPIEVLRRT
jgi:HTH-type transcriptional regulator / antitoxin HigA